MASPWWVNLLIFVPFVSFWLWRGGLRLSGRELTVLSAWAAAFGVVEGAVVVYLRAIMASAAGFEADLEAIAEFSRVLFNDPGILSSLPPSLYLIEILRETATLVMLIAVAFLAANGAKERWAAFLWTFAIWDIVYYIFLWLALSWPASLSDFDVLFLLPVPWFARVWFPILISALTLLAVAVSKNHKWKQISFM